MFYGRFSSVLSLVAPNFVRDHIFKFNISKEIPSVVNAIDGCKVVPEFIGPKPLT